MTNELEVSDVKLTEVHPDRLTPAMVQGAAGWYTLAVTVRNATDSPLYVISAIRRMRYDATSRVLDVEFTDRPPSEPSRRPASPVRPPPHRRVEPGESVELTFPLSSPIVFLEVSPDGSRQERQVRLLEDVDTVQVRVAFDREPPARVDLAALRPRDRSGEWRGVTAQAWRPRIERSSS